MALILDNATTVPFPSLPSLLPPGATSTQDAPAVITSGAAGIFSVFLALLFGIPAFMVGCRFIYARRIKRIRADDWFMVIAIVFALATTVAMMVELKLISKPTRHLYTLMSIRSALAFSIVYWPAVWGLKMSVLGFYSRGLETLRLKVLMWSLMGLVSAHSLTAVFSALLVCTPASGALTTSHFGHNCRRSSQVQMVHAAINVCFNAMVPLACVVVYLRPRPEGRKNRGFLFGLMVSLASVVVVASIGRTAAFNAATFGQHPALSRSVSVPVATMLEIYVGITAACLPLLGALIAKVNPASLGIGRGDSEADLLAWTPEAKLTVPNPLKTVYHYPLSSEVGPWNTRSSLPEMPKVPRRELSNGSWSSDEIWGMQEATAESSVTHPLPGSAF